jgi:hypothetical protein
MVRVVFLVCLFSVSVVEVSLSQDAPADNRYRTGDTYLQAETVQTDLDGRTATRDVRQDATWRDPENGDAAWIVLKGRPSGGPLVPLRVRGAPAMADNRSQDGAEAAVQVSEDQVTFFVYRAGRGEDSNHWRLEVS